MLARLEKREVYVKRAEWEEIKVRQPYVTIATNENIRLKLDTNSVLSREIFCGFEKEELAFVKRFLKKGDVFIDIGAHIGFFSLLAQKLVGSTGRVLSFEPSPATAAQFKENIVLNHSEGIEVFHMAFSNAKGTCEFYVSANGYEAWNSLAKPDVNDAFVPISVPTTSIDEFLADQALAPSGVKLIKIDVEGWEKTVLSGGRQSLAANNAPALLVEFTERNLRNAGCTGEELYRQIESLGYRLYRYDYLANSLQWFPSQEWFSYMNLVALKPYHLQFGIKGQ